MNTDKDGYIMVENSFEYKGYNFSFVKDFNDGWRVYKKSKEGCFDKFELVKFKKQEEWNFKGKIIPKKWKYPNNEDFGRIGFDCVSMERAVALYKEIKKNKEEKEEKLLNNPASEMKIPNVEFTCSDLLKKNKNCTYSDVYIQLKKWLDEGQIKKCGERKNKKGKPSMLYVRKV